MLHFGAVKPGIRVLIFDQCSGVVTTHVVERLGGFGRCVVLHNGKSASNLLCYHNRQFSPKVASTFRTLSVRKMLEHSSGAKPTEDAERMEAEEADGEQKHPNGRVMTESDIAFRDEKNRQTAEALEWFANERTPGFGDYDALFVVCRNAASISVLEHTFRAVRSSGNIVVYSPNSADIATSREYLEKRGCVFVDTRSSVCREIQVLKHRTHPVMQQITPGGFILSAIRGFAP
ncbi:hypothetical protein M3Y99_00421500 [Aphelenchoides fujianensis]|nr:hypothetical protein M3Y99_00421500 [Aphelenchoides fujianensis]